MIARCLCRFVFNYRNRARALHTQSKSLNDLVLDGNVDALTAQLTTETSVDINVPDERGWTPLMLAAKAGHHAITEALLSAGRPVDTTWCNRFGHSAVDIAMFYQHKDVYNILIRCVMAYMAASGQTAERSVCDEPRPMQRDLTDMGTFQQLSEIAALPSSVFLILHNGWPLIANGYRTSGSGKRSPTVSLVKLHYSSIASVVTERNLVYLGMAQASSDVEALSGAQSAAGPGSQESSVAHFCIDLSTLSAAEVIGLCDMDIAAELIHPYSFLRLSSEERLLYCRAWPVLDWHRRNQFCSTCGSLTSMAEGGYKLICRNSSCLTHKGTHNTTHPRVDPSVLCAVVSTDNQCLLVRKPSFPSQMYSLVAGFTDAGENLEQTCAREVYEEVGVTISNLRYHGSQFWPGPSVLMVGYSAQASSSQQLVVDTKELEAAHWFHRADVVSMLIHENDEHYFIPPAAFLAHKLIKSWVLDSAFTELAS